MLKTYMFLRVDRFKRNKNKIISQVSVKEAYMVHNHAEYVQFVYLQSPIVEIYKTKEGFNNRKNYEKSSNVS